SVTLTLAAPSGATITATHLPYSTLFRSSQSVTVYPAPLDHFVVEKSGGGGIGMQTAGTAFSIQVTAEDHYGNTLSFGPNAFNGKVDISSTQTCSPACPVTTATSSAGVLS